MTATPGHTPPPDRPPGPGHAPVIPAAHLPRAVPIPPDLRLAAAERLVAVAESERRSAAKKLLASAPSFGIDLNLMWGVPAADGRSLLSVALVVPGAGRTGMMFLSRPIPDDAPRGHPARVAAVLATIANIRSATADRVAVVQGLPEPNETWAIDALAAAGMIRLGRLLYLRRPLHRAEARQQAVTGQALAGQGMTGLKITGLNIPGVRVEPVGDLDDPARREALRVALEASYADTLDCPELCGLRETRDVIESHRATGVFDPKLWWLVFADEQPMGCVLLNRCPDHQAIELVYMGLGPALRGRRLGAALLGAAIADVSAEAADSISCAVDERNTPARKLYAQLGFQPFSERVPFVRGV